MLMRAHDLVRVSDAANVFHGSVFVIWTHYMVNFSEGIPLAEILLVKFKGCFSNSKHEFVAQILCKGLPHINPLGDMHWVIICENFVRSCTNRV